MDLKHLLRMGSLTMNLLQSDHMKELMGMMNQMHSPFGGTWLGNVPAQRKDTKQQKTNDSLGSSPFEHPWFPFQSGNNFKNQSPFPFMNGNMPPWMMQRPRQGMQSNRPNRSPFGSMSFLDQLSKWMQPAPSNTTAATHLNQVMSAVHQRNNPSAKISIQDMTPGRKNHSRGKLKLQTKKK
ncbi:hypothetical protein LSG31_22440 [Fodinisporobacter ferrooxydans]|uniref:Uncharacterized protein n=1 Tax=Fodinisporobacter ferrooxydans TaxID=2901836 RepID=A0ABY4CJK6_9BACL|nr:hypothetical protein LSG31_22440 [Alicyclobacillaceae bacterium MYW30-H2]